VTWSRRSAVRHRVGLYGDPPTHQWISAVATPVDTPVGLTGSWNPFNERV
jgi:hypothetical protein